jgi:hypothetical protein
VNRITANEALYKRQPEESPVTRMRGLMLITWGFACALGPLLIARIQESTGLYRGVLHFIVAFITSSTMVPFLASSPQPSKAGPQAEPGEPRSHSCPN